MKKSLLIILVLLSFTLNVNAEWYNPMDWGQSEQDERIEDIEDISDNISDLSDRFNQLDKKEYTVSDLSYCILNPWNCNDNYERDATEEERENLIKKEKEQIEAQINDLSNDKNTIANEYNSNETALKEYEKRAVEAIEQDWYSDAFKKQTDIELYKNERSDYADNTIYDPEWCFKKEYSCNEQYRRYPTEEEINNHMKELGLDIPIELTEAEKKLLDDFNISFQQYEQAKQIVEDWWVLMTEDQRKALAEKQKNDQIETQKNNEDAIKAEKAKAEQDNLDANPWLEAIQNKWNTDTMNALLWITDNKVLNWTDANSKDGWFTVLSKFTVWFKNTLTWLVQLIAVWALLFVWIRLAFARWNPEEFKKALVHMVYVIVWIFVIAVSWAAVVLVAWINI